MIKRDQIVERLASKGYTKKSARMIIDDLMETITEALVEGESVQFHGFGTFYVKDTASRSMVDMQTKERITIPGRKTPKFSPGGFLKKCVQEGTIRE